MRKNDSPIIPTNTCPYIDHVIFMIGELHDLVEEKNFSYASSIVETLKAEMEHIRNSNDMLRTSGKYWYEKVKK